MRERAQRESASESTEIQQTAEVEEEGRERYAPGEIPPVSDAAEAEAARGYSASELAYDDEQNTKELKDKVEALVKKNHEGDYKKAFEFYDIDKDGGVDKAELVKLLGDADVGNFLTRDTWASRIIEKLDRGLDGKIQWEEFETVFTAQV